jgi:Zn-dependent peptidase ImmA (M78 family)
VLDEDLASAVRSLHGLAAIGGRSTSPLALAVEALSSSLGFPREFFSGEEVEALPAEAATFRALTRLSARERDAALAAGRLALTLREWIESRFELPHVDIPQLASEAPEAAAEAVRARWGMGLGPIPNLVHLLEAHGVRVFSLATDCSEVDAFSLWREGKPFVFLNTNKSGERSRMDAAHELGHLVLHPEYDRSVSRQLERDAALFASAFLMPRASLIGRHGMYPTLDELVHGKREWSVSLAAYVQRLYTAGLITEWHHRSLFIELSKRGYRSGEPDGIERERSQILEQVFGYLRREGVTRSDVARALFLSKQDLDVLVLGLVFSSVDGAAECPGRAQRGHIRVVGAQ